MKTRILSAIALLAFLIWNPYPLQVLELKTFDWLMSTKPEVTDNMILLVDIDEDFIQGVGGYPIPRSYYGHMIKRTNAIPGITVLMPDPDLRGLDEDWALANELEEIRTVLAFTASTQATEGGPHVGTAALGEDPRPWLFEYPGILRQLPVLADASSGVGLITTAPEIDGLVRRVPLVVNVGDNLYPTFALEMLRVGTGDPSYQIITKETGVEAIRIPSYPVISTDPHARVWTTWNTQFHRQSASDYLKEPVEGATFVIFGVTAEGVANPVPTPGGPKFAHEIQANLLHGLIAGDAPSEPVWAATAELAVAVIIILLLFVTATNVYFSAPIFLSAVGALIYGTWYYFGLGYLLDVTGTIFIAFLFWTIVTFRSFVTQFMLRRQIKKQFGTYVSPDLVKKLQDDPSLLRLGGETKRLTFLFSDIRGFTPISEKYQSDPQKLVEIVNRFLTNQTEIIMKHGGTIDKYMGDCIMAFWNAPLDVEEQERKATEAALEMREALGDLNEIFKNEGIPEIHTGCGINSGLCVVGNMGSNNRFDYSVLGDAVNLAARLESSCKTYETDLIISEYSMVDGYDYKYLDNVTVKGKSEPVKIYTITK
jgi:adenylate cyclase|tara:strand:- start:3677 stop:5464 length:1788 start_codon:yes stop_codon:yes gene_type:complete